MDELELKVAPMIVYDLCSSGGEGDDVVVMDPFLDG
jgi:hypothetical protein